MIRLLLLTFIPLIVPFAVWFIWRVFSGTPQIDPQTGDQVPPDFEKAPRGKLFAAGVVLMIGTMGGFLLAHHYIADEPYKQINVDEFEKRLEGEQMRNRQKNLK
jgi:hypothetical protein